MSALGRALADEPSALVRFVTDRVAARLVEAIVHEEADHPDGRASTASSIVNSIGKQFAQPMRPRKRNGTIKTHLIQQMCRDRTFDVTTWFRRWFKRYGSATQERSHVVVQGDYTEAEAATKHDVLVFIARKKS